MEISKNKNGYKADTFTDYELKFNVGVAESLSRHTLWLLTNCMGRLFKTVVHLKISKYCSSFIPGLNKTGGGEEKVDKLAAVQTTELHSRNEQRENKSSRGFVEEDQQQRIPRVQHTSWPRDVPWRFRRSAAHHFLQHASWRTAELFSCSAGWKKLCWQKMNK